MLSGASGGDDGKKPGRPSREERQRNKLVVKKLRTVSKRGGTRGSAKAFREVEALSGKSAEEIRSELYSLAERNTPPKRMGALGGGPKIYSGKWRGFEQSFADQWWAKQATPWTCYLCGGPINAHATGPQEPSIEHRKPWASIKLEIATQDVCKDGVHWRVALTNDVRATLQDESNLAPSHKGCNSSKNGPKDTDSISPQKIGDCPGATCTLPKAS